MVETAYKPAKLIKFFIKQITSCYSNPTPPVIAQCNITQLQKLLPRVYSNIINFIKKISLSKQCHQLVNPWLSFFVIQNFYYNISLISEQLPRSQEKFSSGLIDCYLFWKFSYNITLFCCLTIGLLSARIYFFLDEFFKWISSKQL